MVSVPNVLSLIIILVFIFVMLAIGVLMYRKRKAGAEDYFLMSRDIPWWLLSMTTMGTMISTFTFLGGVGLWLFPGHLDVFHRPEQLLDRDLHDHPGT